MAMLKLAYRLFKYLSDGYSPSMLPLQPKARNDSAAAFARRGDCHGQPHRGCLKTIGGNDDNESARADSDAEVRAISRADLRSKRRNNSALVNTQLPTDTSRSSPIFLASAAKTPKSPSVVAPVAKFIDWSVIQVLTMRTPRENGKNPRVEEALQFLKGPDFITVESQPAEVEFNPDKSGLHFRFPTPRPGDCAENNVVYGRLYRCAGRWQERPVIVLLHGRNDFINYRCRYPLIARSCNQAGFNAATLEAPYHFQRCPRQPGALSTHDYLQWAEATAQAIAEIRALTGWLLGEGCPAVALWGISMGAWHTGMTVCRDARLTAAVMAIPRVRMDLSAAERVVWRRFRDALPRLRVPNDALDRTPLNLTLVQT